MEAIHRKIDDTNDMMIYKNVDDHFIVEGAIYVIIELYVFKICINCLFSNNRLNDLTFLNWILYR